jgi:hypothetical protein
MNDLKLEKIKSLGVDRVICATDNTPTGEQGWEIVRARFPEAKRFQFPPHRKDVGETKQHEFMVGLP